MNQDLLVNHHKLGLSKNRFWSSPDQLPAIRVIASVLADPVELDLMILKEYFGMKMILEIWDQLLERSEMAESVIPITQKMLNEMLNDNAS